MPVFNWEPRSDGSDNGGSGRKHYLVSSTRAGKTLRRPQKTVFALLTTLAWASCLREQVRLGFRGGLRDLLFTSRWPAATPGLARVRRRSVRLLALVHIRSGAGRFL